jgi:uncharacterized protein (TIGR02265 family)
LLRLQKFDRSIQTLFSIDYPQPEEFLVFEQTIEGLFLRGLQGQMTPALVDRLKTAGLDLTQPLLPGYPFDVWMESLRLTAEALHQDVPLEQGLFRLGEAMIAGYGKTRLGRAIIRTVPIFGPRRTLLRATHHFRSGNNYTESKIIDLAMFKATLWLNEVGPYPTFTAGIIHAALEMSGVDPTVVIQGHDGHACTYVCTWTKNPPLHPLDR